jgi:hypothetical protein
MESATVNHPDRMQLNAKQILILLLAAFGFVCGFLKIFLYGFNVGALFSGLLIAAACSLLALAEIHPLGFFQYITFINEDWGKGGLFIVIGALFADTDWAFWISNWGIFWFFGVVFIILHFTGGHPIGFVAVGSAQ